MILSCVERNLGLILTLKNCFIILRLIFIIIIFKTMYLPFLWAEEAELNL